jgi:hypothetical protein
VCGGGDSEDRLYLKFLLEKVPSKRLHEMKQHLIMETIYKENLKIRSKEIEDKVFVEVEEIQGPKQTIFDPRDTRIRLGIQGKKNWVGSRCHVLETAEKGKINFITDMIYQKSNEDDSRIHGIVKKENDRRGLKPEKVYADTNYISGVAIGEFRKNGKESCYGNKGKDGVIRISFSELGCKDCTYYDECIGTNKIKKEN